VVVPDQVGHGDADCFRDERELKRAESALAVEGFG